MQKRFVEERDATVKAAVAAEIAWLTVAWSRRGRPFRTRGRSSAPHKGLRVPGGKEPALDEDFAEEVDEGGSTIHVESQSAAKWLRLLNEPAGKSVGWAGEIVAAYSGWSSRINGARLPVDAEEWTRSFSEWNTQFYALFAEAVMNADPDQFAGLIEQVKSA